MNKISFVSIAFFSFFLIIAGCGSSPEARFYTLNALSRDAIPTGNLQDAQAIAVKVGPVSLPDTLDQSQIVTRSGSNILELNEFNRWGGDLQADFQRILGENISILLPTDQVILYSEITPLPVDFQVIVNIREFEGELGGMVTLNADWSVIRLAKEKTVFFRKSVFQEYAISTKYQDYVAAQSRLLGKLSREITDEIRKMTIME